MVLLPSTAAGSGIKAVQCSELMLKAKKGWDEMNELNARLKQPNRIANKTRKEASGIWFCF